MSVGRTSSREKSEGGRGGPVSCAPGRPTNPGGTDARGNETPLRRKPVIPTQKGGEIGTAHKMKKARPGERITDAQRADTA